MANRGVYAFEGIDESLSYMPLAVRRLLDRLGYHLSLDTWTGLSVEDRRRLTLAGAGERVEEVDGAGLARVLAGAPRSEPSSEPDPESPPAALLDALGPARPLDTVRWRELRALDRYALVKYAAKPEKLVLAYGEIVHRLSAHLTHSGEVHMVDVGAKPETARRATASARVLAARAAIEAIASGTALKGDVLAAARVAGILAAKRTAELVPLCHPVRTTRATVDFEIHAERGEVQVRAAIEAVDRTGVEMEAMVAASVASLTIYDMIKGLDRWAAVESIRLEEKTGGKSGAVRRPADRGGG